MINIKNDTTTDTLTLIQEACIAGAHEEPNYEERGYLNQISSAQLQTSETEQALSEDKNSEIDGLHKKVTITLIRGLPGVGKTTTALKMNAKHVEADMFFDKNGKYCFEGRKIKDAHIWCQSQAKYHLNQGEDVVVSNTFVKIDELKPYIDASKVYGASLQIIEFKKNYKNTHNVPDSTIAMMRRNWEKLPDDLKVYLVPNCNSVITNACKGNTGG